MPVTISQLNIYPVKGLKGIAVESAMATGRGLAHDRRFMVVDQDRRFLSQRELPVMATVWTEIAGSELRLAAPECGEVAVPVAPVDGEPLDVGIWSSTCRAIAPSREADRWLASFLARSCRLVYMPEETERPVDPRYAGPGHCVGFADAFPVLVAGEASLADLNARLPRPVPMDRFRANVVLSGAGAFAEDGWLELRAGEVRLRLAKPCGRCQVTTTDQATGEVHSPEPLATLSAYRPSKEFGARFGMNAVVLHTGLLQTGMEVATTI
ncbi:MAG TPA: MOSC N-terminal beta barrel domain-containing protein [Usitatibacteraceae bacterium]|nr:MOSC N-terminal beta barrel domain-containing protein [Usitatibacteraceae bacterium]